MYHISLNDNLNNYLPLSGGTITGIISGSSGGKFSYDGNVYLKTDGFDGWISTILNNLTNKLGTSKGWYYPTLNNCTGVAFAKVQNGIAYINLEITPTQIINDTILISNLPVSSAPIYHSLIGINGSVYPVLIINGNMSIYYSEASNMERIDCTFSYPL